MRDARQVSDHGEDRLLPWRAVREIIDISRTTAWRMQRAGDFPEPVLMSPGRVGWWESDLKAWKNARAPRGDAAFQPFVPVGKAGRSKAQPLSAIDRIAPQTSKVTAAGWTAPAPARASRRRSAPTATNQTAFDF